MSCAIAARDPVVLREVAAEVDDLLKPEAIQATKTAAAHEALRIP